MPPERKGATVGRKRYWRVCSILRGPEGAVTVEWEGRRARAKICEQRRKRWEWT